MKARNTLVLASNNKNKLAEVKAILPAIKIKSLKELKFYDEIDETQNSIEGNALLKARYIFKKFELPTIADDTGLFVDALNGAPGVYSARYAGLPTNAEKNIAKLLNALKSENKRDAFFKTVIAFKDHKNEIIFEGIIEGEILNTPKGNDGFGYDPIFLPKGYGQSFAEMDYQIKNKISHRALAIEKFSSWFNSNK